MDNEYTPTTDEVFEATVYTWVDWKGRYDTGDSARDGFDRWLAKVKAEAWDEGYDYRTVEYRQYEEERVNPYRKADL